MTSTQHSDADKRINLAQHWLSVNRPERALDEIGRLPGDEALSVPASLIRAAALIRTERAAEARDSLTQALTLHGPHIPLLESLTHAYRQLDQLEDAERAVLEGLTFDPHHVGLLCAYAEICLLVGQVKKAEALLDRAAAVEPDAEEVATARVLVASAKGRRAEAYRLAREALGKNPDNLEAHAYHSIAATERGKLRAASESSDRLAAELGDRDLVDVAREDRAIAHPLLLPLWPILRFGPMKVWVAGVVVLMVLRQVSPQAMLVAAVAWVTYVVYSWVAPPLVRRYLARRRGV